MLQGFRTSLAYVVICTFTVGQTIYLTHQPLPDRFFPLIYIVFFSLTGIAFLQWYFSIRVNGLITAQSETNRTLENEIALRHRIEEDRREKETQLVRLAEYTNDLVAEIDISGKYLYNSPSYRMVLGYEPEELLNKNGLDLVHPDDLPIVKKGIGGRAYTGRTFLDAISSQTCTRPLCMDRDDWQCCSRK